MATQLKQVALYVTPEVHDALRVLSERTRVPQSIYLREAVDDLLAKYKVRPTSRRKSS
jgi:predicted DNA-binding protein